MFKLLQHGGLAYSGLAGHQDHAPLTVSGFLAVLGEGRELGLALEKSHAWIVRRVTRPVYGVSSADLVKGRIDG